MRVERGFLHGGTVEVIKVMQDGRVLLAFDRDELDEASRVADEILHLVAQWREQVEREAPK